MRKKKVLILVIAILFSLLIVGTSYAYFGASAQSNVQNYSVGDFSFTLTEDNGKLTLASSYPISDTEGMATDPYVFSVTNTGEVAANYQIILKEDQEAIANCGCTKILDMSNIKYQLDGGEIGVLSSGGNQVITEGSLNASQKKTFSLRIWLKEDSGNEVLGTHFHGKIQVVFY